MSYTYSRTFRVRHYECDAYGHLNHTHYARYMQETAFDASSEAGFGPERYAAMQRLWLIRETQIDFLQSLEYNDRATVLTYVADMRRVTSHRSYEFHRTNGVRVAQGWSNWVFMDTAANHPTRIPAEVIQAFFPDAPPSQAPEVTPYPRPPAPPQQTYQESRRVAWSDMDALQHVNNAVYLEYASDCGFNALAAYGWPWTRLAQSGLGIFVRRLHAQYLLQAVYGDELIITTWMYALKRAMFSRHYTIRRKADLSLLAQVNTLSVCVDLASRQPRRLPQDMQQDLAGCSARETTLY